MNTNHFTFIKVNKKYIKIYFDGIAYIKGLGNYVEFFMIGGERYIYYKSLRELIDALPPQFMRIHNSYIVNLITIDSFEDNHIHIGSTAIAVGKSYRECLKTAIEKLLL